MKRLERLNTNTNENSAEELKMNVIRGYRYYLEVSPKFRKLDKELQALELANYLQDYYYHVIGIGSDSLWKRIDKEIEEYLGVEV